MANVSIIEKHDLGREVLELSLEHNVPEILTILKQRHNVKIGYKTIQRYLERVREERKEQTKAVINEYVKKSIPTDLERLDKVITGLNDRFDMADSDRDAASLAGPLLKAIDMKLEYSGAGKGPEVIVNVSEWRDVLRVKASPRGVDDKI